MAGTRLQLNDLNLTPYISTGSAVAYNISIERITSYSDKETFFIDFHTICGDAPTLNINGLGAKNIIINGVNLVTGQLLPNSGYFVKYSSSLDKFIIVGGGGGGTMNCSDVKDCIEGFSDLDLSNLETLILGGPSTDIYINGSTIHYDSVTENRSGDSEINLEEGASITNNLDGTVNNNYGDTYEENNNYEEGSIINNTGEVINNYEDYTENNDYGDNVEINNNYSSDTIINNNGGTHNFNGNINMTNLNVANLTILGAETGNNYLILTGTMAGTPPEVDIADTRITDTTPYLVFFETQPVGQITRTLTNGNLNIASDDNADTLDVKVLFWNIGPARNYMKGNTTLTGAGPRTITDPRITATTPAMLFPRTTPVGYLTAVTGAGTMTISSTGTEVGVIVDYIITLDTTNYSDGMPYNATLDDDDMFFRKGAVSGDDEAVKWSDMKTSLGTLVAGTRFISAQALTQRHTTSYTYVKLKEIQITTKGIYTIQFQVWGETGTSVTYPAMFQLYKNGIPAMAEITRTNNTVTDYTVDLALDIGDLVQLSAHHTVGLNAFVLNMYIKYDYVSNTYGIVNQD